MIKVTIKKVLNVHDKEENYLVIENTETGARYVEQKATSVSNKIEEVINGKLDKSANSSNKEKTIGLDKPNK